ncbi:DNA -binding domain-containing protein [Sphingopyxis fribergensis]
MPRGGGCTFAEDPRVSAPAARLLWTRAADPSVLTARIWPRGDAQVGADPPRPSLDVGSANARHVVFGGSLTGVRVDIAGDEAASLAALRFELSLTAALPVQLGELARLWRYYAGGLLDDPPPGRDAGRAILVLRTIDALAEGASLRAVGAGLVSGDDWPGEGDWIKSRARRLVAAARTMWAGGPRSILAMGMPPD